MKITVDLPDLQEMIEEAVRQALVNQQAKLIASKYYSLEVTAAMLQVKPSTVLDRRRPYMHEIEYAQEGRTFWFVKTSVEKFISSRLIVKYRG